MAASPMDGVYFEFSTPLGLKQLIEEVIKKNQHDPNTPQLPVPTATRQWFSQPRPSAQGVPPVPTLFWAGGTLDLVNGALPLDFPDTSGWLSVDPGIWNRVDVDYPAAMFPMKASIAAGKQAVIDAINKTSPGTPFALGGASQGALVMSEVYDEIRSGSLQYRRADLVAATMFGNPLREQGKMFPGCPDPGVWSDPFTGPKTGRPVFYYARTNSTFIDIFSVDDDPTGVDTGEHWIDGIDGGGTFFDAGKGTAADDPFPLLVEQLNLWDVKVIDFSDTTVPRITGIQQAVSKIVAAIKAKPGPFALGGYSTGAWVMSLVLQELQHGNLQDRMDDLVAGVTFGNPLREEDHTWPGDAWSGVWDSSGSVSGGHGVLPNNYRLDNTPDQWWDFVNQDDIITCVGSTAWVSSQAFDYIFPLPLSGQKVIGQYEQIAAAILTGTGGFVSELTEDFDYTYLVSQRPDIFTAVLLGMGVTYNDGVAENLFRHMNLMTASFTFTTGTGDLLTMSGGGHVSYAIAPPPDDPQSGLTSYQIALNYLKTVGAQWQGTPQLVAPEGHGCFADKSRLVDTEDLWWEFANVGDPIATCGDDATGVDLQFYSNYVFLGEFVWSELFTSLISHTLPATIAEIRAVSELLHDELVMRTHYGYGTIPAYSGASQTAAEIATSYLNGVGLAWLQGKSLPFSQRRYTFSNQTEVLTVNLKLPMSVSEIGFDALRVGVKIEVWYQDRQSNWRQVLDESRNPLVLILSASSAAAWYTAHWFVYPIVAKSVQFRFTRLYDPVVGTVPYCVGMKNALIRRNIYTRSDGTQAIDSQQDAMGNTISSYIRDWDAAKAIDDDPHTFWRSMPMPDPEAVVALYLDCRDPLCNAQLMDTLYIDPVYTGQSLNIYYSNDETVGTLKLSPVSAIPSVNKNTQWQLGVGMWDVGANPPVPHGTFGTSSYDPGTSDYQFSMGWGPLTQQDCWIGIEWAPDFAPDGAPPANCVLFSVTPPAGAPATQYSPTIYYDVGAGELVLKLTNGTVIQSFAAILSPLPIRQDPVRIVAGWGYPTYDEDDVLTSPARVFISVKTASGVELVSTIVSLDHVGGTPVTTPGNLVPFSALPPIISLDGTIGFTGFRGLFTAHVVKLENWTVGQTSFQANPLVYVSPDPVVPNPSGDIPSTTLDNAIYAAAWTMQESGTGGCHESAFESKTWTPVWKDYITQKGKLFFPQQISVKYLKLEFTNLTEESYPVYDSGIQTSYEVFPMSVYQTVVSKRSVLRALGSDVVLGGVGSVNWLNSSTVNAAVNSIYGQTLTPVLIQSGPGTTLTSLPNINQTDLYNQTRQEVSSPWVYKRTPLNSSILAAHTLKVAANSESNQTMVASTAAIGWATGDFAPAIPVTTNLATVGSQGQDYWIFPGGTLKMPANIMNGLTRASQTVTVRKATTESRLRFATTCVHRYQTKTVSRDAAVAYFAGIREVHPYVTHYIESQDPPKFVYSVYDPTQWVMDSYIQLDTGPVTTSKAQYRIVNPQFDPEFALANALLHENDLGTVGELGLYGWSQEGGGWELDVALGHWYPGTAHIAGNGFAKRLVSSKMDVLPGAHVDASVWVKWTELDARSNSMAIQLQALYFDAAGNYLSNAAVGITNATWPEASGNPSYPWTQIVASAATGNTFLVPSGAAQMSLGLAITEDLLSGDVWFDSVEVGTADPAEATLHRSFQTTSSMSRLNCTFRDSGLVRSDSMWTQIDANDTNISSTSLAYYTDTIPDVIPAGMWNDQVAKWSDPTITWGAEHSTVAIQVDPNRIYQGKRVLHFSRAASANSAGVDEVGVKIRQQTNFVANGMFRIGATYYKPYDTTLPGNTPNEITVRLMRVSDGVHVYEETFTPVIGFWYEFLSDLIEIPDSQDQVYTVELVCRGDNPDELYLNDLYTEVAAIRYHVRLGDSSQFLHDVTSLRYADSATVSCTEPVNEFFVATTILSPRAYAYGCTLEPLYLK